MEGFKFQGNTTVNLEHRNLISILVEYFPDIKKPIGDHVVG